MRWQRQYKTAEILEDLKEHDGVKELLEEIKGSIEAINAQLLNGQTKTEIEQERLHTDRERCEWLINIFENQKVIKDNILKRLEKL